jgi:hypothetical protein
MSTLLTGNSATELWHALVRQGEERAHRHLDENTEAYLVFTLMRHYRDVPLAHRTMALEWLAALDQAGRDRQDGLRDVGDRCLLLAGLYPQLAERRRVSLGYFVELGRGAYDQLAGELRDALAALYRELANCFDDLVRVLLALRDGGAAMPELLTAPAQPAVSCTPIVLAASTRRH